MDWRVLDGGNPELEVDWRETGFAAAEPSHSGVGTRIIERLLSAETGGAVERRFGDDGHRTLIRIPLDRALHPDA